jgi:hypothetical protein
MPCHAPDRVHRRLGQCIALYRLQQMIFLKAVSLGYQTRSYFIPIHECLTPPRRVNADPRNVARHSERLNGNRWMSATRASENLRLKNMTTAEGHELLHSRRHSKLLSINEMEARGIRVVSNAIISWPSHSVYIGTVREHALFYHRSKGSVKFDIHSQSPTRK